MQLMVIGSQAALLGIVSRDECLLLWKHCFHRRSVFTICGLAALFVLVFLALVVLASFGVIDGKFLLELIRAFRK